MDLGDGQVAKDSARKCIILNFNILNITLGVKYPQFHSSTVHCLRYVGIEKIDL